MHWSDADATGRNYLTKKHTYVFAALRSLMLGLRPNFWQLKTSLYLYGTMVSLTSLRKTKRSISQLVHGTLVPVSEPSISAHGTLVPDTR